MNNSRQSKKAVAININNDNNQNNKIYNEWNIKDFAINIAAWTAAQQSLTAPYEPTKDTMNKSRQSKAAGISINNSDNRNHRIYKEWNTKNYEKHAGGTAQSPVPCEQHNDTMNNSRQSKAADMSTNNHENRNNNIYNEWNNKNDVAVDINISNNVYQNSSIYNEWNTTKN